MKKYWRILFLSACLTVVSCGKDDIESMFPEPEVPEPEQPVKPEIELTEEGSLTFVMKGYESDGADGGTLQPEGFPVSIGIKDKSLQGTSCKFALSAARKLVDMPKYDTMIEWKDTLSIVEGRTCWIRYTTDEEYRYLKLRIAYIFGDEVGVEYKISDVIQKEIQNINANGPIEGKSFVKEYSMPHLNSENYYVEHTVTYGGKEILNYAYEWVESKKHTAWVAFSFDKTTSQKKVSRSDVWATDQELPEGWCPEESNHISDGFDKGHLCASEDRVYSKEANEQTFYYSNMSPQMSSFNGGFWASFENLIRKWARSREYDKLYVAKGGTVDQLLVNFTGTCKGNDGVLPQTDANGFTIKGLACPKYYFMAILSEKGDEYHAVGFWMEHREDYGYEYNKFAPSDVMKKYALSIDDLEKNTKLDFFCNLPDDIENAVESSWKETDWTW